MQCPVCKNDGVHEDALMCPHCKRQIREMTDEEREVIRKEEKNAMKGILMGGIASFIVICIIFAPFVYILLH